MQYTSQQSAIDPIVRAIRLGFLAIFLAAISGCQWTAQERQPHRRADVPAGTISGRRHVFPPGDPERPK